MAFYQVQGTSTVSWSLLVEGKGETEASAAAVRIVARLADLRRERAVRDSRHEVTDVRRVITTPARDQGYRGPEARTGDE